MLAGLGINPLELDNIGKLFGLPFLGDRVSASNAGNEGLGAHCPLDPKVSEVIGEVEQPAPIFDAGDILANINAIIRRLFDPPHTVHSPRSKPERFESAPQFLNGGNPVTDSFNVVTVPFLPTAFFFGRATEQNRRFVGVTTPANDNDPWQEAA